MRAITTIGLDIAKSVFQVHGVDAEGNVVIRRQHKQRHVLAFFEKMCVSCGRPIRDSGRLGRLGLPRTKTRYRSFRHVLSK